MCLHDQINDTIQYNTEESEYSKSLLKAMGFCHLNEKIERWSFKNYHSTDNKYFYEL
jgi:hypothetical protein